MIDVSIWLRSSHIDLALNHWDDIQAGLIAYDPSRYKNFYTMSLSRYEECVNRNMNIVVTDEEERVFILNVQNHSLDSN
jgi:hypothetical protein